MMNYFICCKKNPNFKKTKKGYVCLDCGKFYLEKNICYCEENTEFKKIQYARKYKGRKSDYINNGNNALFSTLQTGKVDLMYVNENYETVEKKSFIVKKNVMEHKINSNNTILTVTEKGMVNVYNIETEEMISQIKLGIEYSPYKIKFFAFGKNGDWLYIDTKKVIVFSNDLRNFHTILLFENFLEGNEIKSILSVDHNSENDCFSIHICYWKKGVTDTYLNKASFFLKYDGYTFNIEKNLYESKLDLTFDFQSQKYYGIYHNKMITLSSDYVAKELCELPVVKKYSDGGIFWIEEFTHFPEKLYCLENNMVVLLYIHEIIILDVDEHEIKYAIDTKLDIIQSFIILDRNTICFSAGLSTYIVQINGEHIVTT